jgi:hypothetical protein
MGVIDEIKQKIDIVELVGQYVKLTKSGRTMRNSRPGIALGPAIPEAIYFLL